MIEFGHQKSYIFEMHPVVKKGDRTEHEHLLTITKMKVNIFYE